MQIGEELSIRESDSLLPCVIVQRYEHNGAVWLVLKHKETGTQFRRPEASFIKPSKAIKLAEGGNH